MIKHQRLNGKNIRVVYVFTRKKLFAAISVFNLMYGFIVTDSDIYHVFPPIGIWFRCGILTAIWFT